MSVSYESSQAASHQVYRPESQANRVSVVSLCYVNGPSIAAYEVTVQDFLLQYITRLSCLEYMIKGWMDGKGSSVFGIRFQFGFYFFIYTCTHSFIFIIIVCPILFWLIFFVSSHFLPIIPLHKIS